MTTFTARRDDQSRNTPERRTEAQYGYTMWTVFVDDPAYPYSLGYIRENHGTHAQAPAGFRVFNISRRGIGLHLPPADFASRADAFAYIRQAYETALAYHHALVSSAFAAMRSAEGLSTTEGGDPDALVVVGLIFPDPAQLGGHYAETRMTVREALTGLDYLFARAGIVLTIVGRVIPGAVVHRHGYAEWTVPAGSANYHLEGVRSTTGQARAYRVRAA